MRWFQRDHKFYIGPVTDLQIDMLKSNPLLENSGVSWSADRGRVEAYVTVPVTRISPTALDRLTRGTVAV